MNTEIITDAARATLSGTLSFPEVVRRLIETGVEYYHVDYIALRKAFYSATGDMVTTPIAYEGLPPVAADFDAAGLRAAIVDSQNHGQSYRDFTRRAMEAGVQGYFAFLRGQRVTLLESQWRSAYRMVSGSRPRLFQMTTTLISRDSQPAARVARP